MVGLNPDIIFLIGDNVYADFPVEQTSPSILWERNFQTRERLGLFRSKQLVPVVATWDDHDFGLNNAGSEYPYKQQSLTVFKTFFASDDSDNFSMPNIGVASELDIYGFNFFLLDNRTFRTPIGATPEWHFGKAQSQWLLDNLTGKEHAFIISGDQFFGGYAPKDSFQGQRPQRFAEFLQAIKAIDTKVVFLSGDRHFTEIMEIPADRVGYTTYELTSSPIQSLPRPFLFPNPLRIEGQDMTNNFMLVEVSEGSKGLHLYATSYDEKGKILFKRKLNIE
ncbi:MAG: alkaline phosphatase D family protein [Pseudomonadota bacterium]|nr:alkaline phosphatase D family protein [Pseudomonadota bacterium]